MTIRDAMGGRYWIGRTAGADVWSSDWQEVKVFPGPSGGPRGHTGDNPYTTLWRGREDSKVALMGEDGEVLESSTDAVRLETGSKSVIPTRERLVVSCMAKQLFLDLLVGDLAGLVGRYT